MESGPPPWRRHFGRRAGHRPLLGAVVDAGLATGVALQAMVRNVLADPYILGVPCRKHGVADSDI